MACAISFSHRLRVYGDPVEIPVTENTPTAPISPHGWSKLMTEIMLRDADTAHDLRYIILRYFNVAGADPHCRTGQSSKNATHLIKVAVEAALGLRAKLDIYGTDYPTPDGTCIRDYIHVSDLVRAHADALHYLRAGRGSLTLNCGYGHGFSVREVIEMVKRVSGIDFKVSRSQRVGRAIQPRSSRPLIPPARNSGGRHSTMISPPSLLMLSLGSRNCDDMA
jgi:UDP-glucose 4-epimerase